MATARSFGMAGPDSAMRSFGGGVHYKDGVALFDIDTDTTASEQEHRAWLNTTSLRFEQKGAYYNQARTQLGIGEITVARYYDSLDGNPMFVTTLGQNINVEHGNVNALVLNGNDVNATRVTADTIHAASVVTTPKWRIPDYVFEPGYARKSLSEVESFVRTNRHLPGVPSAKDIAASGLDLAEMSLRLLKNVEELTLHVIDLDKKNSRLEEELEGLKASGREDRP
jgi:hypothetical protein